MGTPPDSSRHSPHSRPRGRTGGQSDSGAEPPDAGDQAGGQAGDLFDNWLIPAHDARGHSVRELIRISPGMERAMEIIIQSGKTPYRTKSDLVRHAIYRHLLQMEDRLPRLGKHFLVGLRLSQQLLQDEAYREELERLFSRMELSIKYFLERGEVGEATKQAALQWAQFSVVGNSPWKRAYVQRFLRLYGYLLGFRSPGVVLLTPAGPDEPVVIDAEIVDRTEMEED